MSDHALANVSTDSQSSTASKTISDTITDTTSEERHWLPVCAANDLHPCIGVRALIDRNQVAIFRVGADLYAIDAMDPFSKAAVLSRGLVGDIREQVVVASPIYKQHFNLDTGVCLEDETVAVRTWKIREFEGRIEVSL